MPLLGIRERQSAPPSYSPGEATHPRTIAVGSEPGPTAALQWLVPAGVAAAGLAAGRLLHTRFASRAQIAVAPSPGAAADAAGAAAQLRPAVRDVEQTLRYGLHVPGPQKWVGADNFNHNGALPVITLRHPHKRELLVEALVKGPNAQAAEEEYAWKIAQALEIEHLVPAAVRRPDGSVYVEMVPGEQWSERGLHRSTHVEQSLERHYGALGLDPQAAVAAARRDTQLLRFYDYLLANFDRHSGNGLVDARTGAIWLIDNGLIGSDVRMAYEGRDALRPLLGYGFQDPGRSGVVHLDNDVVELIRTRLTPERIISAHRTLTAPAGAREGVELQVLQKLRQQAFLRNVLARRHEAVEKGSYQYAERTQIFGFPN